VVTNISAGGCAAALSEAVAVGTVVQVDLEATGMSPAHVTAQVTRCLLTASPHGRWEIGLSFVDLTEAQAKQLSQYLKLYA
jgi:c-di-GMP-binding flagellar brake protein YcgR